MLIDIEGLHFTGQGYKLLFDSVQEKLETTWPELSALAHPPVFPYWQEAFK